MKNITIKNYKGAEFSGDWNGKTYPSTVEGRTDLVRIYVNNEVANVSAEEIKNLGANIDKDIKIKKMESLENLVRDSNEEELVQLMLNILASNTKVANALYKHSDLQLIDALKSIKNN